MRPFFVDMPSVAIYTLGCRVNAFESACIADSARLAGFDVVDWQKGADIGIVNSCALTTLAEAKTRQEIRIFARKNPQSKIAITGCYAQTDPESLKLENVKWIVGNKSKADIVNIISQDLQNEMQNDFYNVLLEKTSAPDLSACGNSALSDRMNLKIQDGCDNACSYCIIPRARGVPRSMDFDDIVGNAKNLVERGVREIVLTGINISKFSTTKGGLVEVIDALNEIKELVRIRIGSIEPPLLPLEAILERAKDSSHKLMPHLHISAQSFSDVVLERMRRRYKASEFLSMLEKCVSLCPDIAVGGDIICGHPAETQSEFEKTKAIFASSPMAYMHVFTFSPRPKTLAYTMRDVPPVPERKARADELREVAKEVKMRFVKSQLGKKRKLLLEHQISSNTYFAHTDNYIPAIVPMSKEGMKNALVSACLKDCDARWQLLVDGVELV